MKLNVGQVMAAYDAFGRLVREKLPPRGGYWVARLVKKLEPEFVAAEERRVALIKEMGVEDGNGGWKVPEDKIAEYVERWKPIVNEEIDLGDMPKIKLEHFGDKPLAVGDMLAVEAFIDEI